MHECVIVIPVFKSVPNKYEEISLLQCKNVLGKYPIRILYPEKLNTNYYYQLFSGVSDFGSVSFPPKYFKSPQTYNRFMKSLHIYKALKDYDYFLMYHTDAFVFKDELEYWLSKGYDYIGAPIYEYNGTINPTNYLGVGNSGFSLHKIQSKLSVLKSFKKLYSFKGLLKWYKNYNWKGRIYNLIYFLRMFFGLGGWSHHLLNYSKLNEDIFWGVQVPSKFPQFNVAPFQEAYKFSMEYNCKSLFQLNNCELPFGCHQWYKGDFLVFWEEKLRNMNITYN